MTPPIHVRPIGMRRYAEDAFRNIDGRKSIVGDGEERAADERPEAKAPFEGDDGCHDVVPRGEGVQGCRTLTIARARHGSR